MYRRKGTSGQLAIRLSLVALFTHRYLAYGTRLEAYHVRSFSVSQSVLHREVLNTILSAGEEGWREPFKLPL